MKIIINYINNLYKIIRIKFMDDYINNLIDNYYKDANLIGTLPNEFDYLKDEDVVKAEEEDD
jgi:hypothetical protein